MKAKIEFKILRSEKHEFKKIELNYRALEPLQFLKLKSDSISTLELKAQKTHWVFECTIRGNYVGSMGGRIHG